MTDHVSCRFASTNRSSFAVARRSAVRHSSKRLVDASMLCDIAAELTVFFVAPETESDMGRIALRSFSKVDGEGRGCGLKSMGW